MTVYLRWLIASVLVILPWLLLLAAITIFLKPNSESLHISAEHFGVSLIALAVLGLFFVVWVLWRSLEISGWAAEIGSPWTRVSAVILIVLLFIVLAELQPLVLDGIFKSANRQGGIFASFAGWLQGLAAVLAPFSAAVAFFGHHIASLLRQGSERPTVGALVSRAAGRAAVYVVGAATPFLLWTAHLYLCFAGIKDLNPEYVNSTGPYYHAPLWRSDISQRWF